MRSKEHQELKSNPPSPYSKPLSSNWPIRMISGPHICNQNNKGHLWSPNDQMLCDPRVKEVETSNETLKKYPLMICLSKLPNLIQGG
jgi:hypothetical protein